MTKLPNILILGKMCSGKSTIGNCIKSIYPEYIRLSYDLKQKKLYKLFDNNKKKNREIIYNITEKLASMDKEIWVRYILNKIQSLNKPVILEGKLLNHEYEYLKKKFKWYIIKIKITKQLQLSRLSRLSNEKLISNKYENSKIKNIKYDLVIDMDYNNKTLRLEDFKNFYKNYIKTDIDSLGDR